MSLENFFLARQVFTYIAWERHVFACYPFFFPFFIYLFIYLFSFFGSRNDFMNSTEIKKKKKRTVVPCGYEAHG